MASMLDPAEEVVIHSVSFPGEYLMEISFYEKRDQQTDSRGETVAGLVKTLLVDTKIIGQHENYMEIMDLVSEIVDEGLLAIRKPSESFDPRSRRRKARSEDSDTEDASE
jgi:hypothetical protein